MSHYLQYEPKLRKRYPLIADKRRRFLRILFLFTVLAVAGIFFRERIADFLIPGDRSVTVPAFSEMVESIGAGESVRDSFMVFCRKILANGKS